MIIKVSKFNDTFRFYITFSFYDLKSAITVPIFKHDPNARGQFISFDEKEEGTMHVLFNVDKVPSKSIPGIIAHECLHCVHHVLSNKGINESHPHETSCYLMTWFVNNATDVYKIFAKRKKQLVKIQKHQKILS